MRIATWNVNGLRARLPFVLHWLAARRPDVVALQEVKVPADRFPHDAFTAVGYRAAVHAQKGWNGVAILAREEITPTQYGLPGQAELGARLLTARVAGLTLATAYGPNGKDVDHPDFPLKLAWFDTLAAHLHERHRADEPLLVCGDLNVVPAPQDSWSEQLLAGAIFHTAEERARFRALLDWGLVDVFRALHPDRQAFSWWDYRAGAFHRGQGLRIDFLLASASLAARVSAVEIDRDYRKKKEGRTPSDHAPVYADLAWP
jgi:exodeoxyribonuclease-3